MSDADDDAVEYVYDAKGNRTSLTDPLGNTTTWVYDALDRVVQDTNELGYSRYYAYDSAGNLSRYTDRNDRVTEWEYDGLHRVVEERWLDGQTVVRTIAFGYDAAGQLVAVDDAEADYAYIYDSLGRVTSSSLDLLGLGQMVTLSYSHDLAGRRTELSAEIGTTQDFVNSYAYDSSGRLSRLDQAGVVGGNAVAEKRVDFAYDPFGRTSAITRYSDLAGTELVAATSFTYDSAGRLTELMHRQGTVDLAGYTWTYDAAGRMTQFTSLLDGTVNYTHDDRGQLTGADYDYQTDESYTYDENGNRAGGGYVVGPNNQLLSDGVYNYAYDQEGNRIRRTEIATGHVTEYEWDHRNRLVRVLERESQTGPAVKVVEHTYDYLNRWVGRSVDSDGAGLLGFENTYFVYDGTPEGVSLLDRAAVTAENIGQIVLQFEDDAQGDPRLAHRNLWGAAVDQILADEQVTDPEVEGDVLYALTDHLGTVRDVVERDPSTGQTTVASHRRYDAFGKLIFETAVVDFLFGHTGRALDEETELQNNLNRWYDVGWWISEDPIGFTGGDANLGRYCGNTATSTTVPSGLDRVIVVPVFEPQSLWDSILKLAPHVKSDGIALWYSAHRANGLRIGTARLLDSIGGGFVYGDITLDPQYGGGTISQAIAQQASALAAHNRPLRGETEAQYISRLIKMAVSGEGFNAEEWWAKWEREHPPEATLRPFLDDNPLDNAWKVDLYEREGRMPGSRWAPSPGGRQGAAQIQRMWDIRTGRIPVTEGGRGAGH